MDWLMVGLTVGLPADKMADKMAVMLDKTTTGPLISLFSCQLGKNQYCSFLRHLLITTALVVDATAESGLMALMVNTKMT